MPPVTETQPLPSEASPTSVLLVEDDRATAALTKALVQESGTYVVECEADLASALRRITSTAYDCVLLDVHLPDAHGADAVRRIRRIAPGLPILLLSGMESGALQRLAIQSGAQVSLPKDHLDRDLLQSGIRTAMDREAVEATHGYNRRLAELLEIAGGIQHIGDRITRVLDVVRANLGMDLGIVARIEGSRYVVEHVASTDDGQARVAPCLDQLRGRVDEVADPLVFSHLSYIEKAWCARIAGAALGRKIFGRYHRGPVKWHDFAARYSDARDVF